MNRPEIEQPRDPSIRHIPLTGGYTAIVDAEDYERLSAFNWYKLGEGRRVYAYRKEFTAGKWKTLAMHRLIVECPNGKDVDHADGNSLNNRKSNLRICTRQQNCFNAKLSKRSTSGLKGVHITTRGRCIASICYMGKMVALGSYDTAQEAHAAYYGAARMVAGVFARAA